MAPYKSKEDRNRWAAEWREKNRDKIRASDANRKARKADEPDEPDDDPRQLSLPLCATRPGV